VSRPGCPAPERKATSYPPGLGPSMATKPAKRTRRARQSSLWIARSMAFSPASFIERKGQIRQSPRRSNQSRAVARLEVAGGRWSGSFARLGTDCRRFRREAKGREAAWDITALGSYSVLGLVVGAAAIYVAMTRNQGPALWLLASVIGGATLSTLLKIGFNRPRPDLVAHSARVFTMSFPSGHAGLSTIAYLALGSLLASAAPTGALKMYFMTLALLLTISVGITRIYLGVHYPTDVLAGWCLGAAWAILCCLGWLWFENRRNAALEVELSRR
jgi:membrane-associated phospholipid phosphatase